jgi:hypothetical protein
VKPLHRVAALPVLAWLAAAAVAGEHATVDPEEAVHAMLRRLVSSPEATARVSIERSDPFGGRPEREQGRLWYLPGRGLRYLSERKGGQDLVIDRERDAFRLYSASQRTIYSAPFARAPLQIRRLIADPERILSKNLQSTPERRVVHGTWRPGFRLRSASLGDSIGEVSTWIAADPSSGLPRWIAVFSEAESVLVELRGLTLLKSARPRDLVLSAPKGTPEEPLDPRELLGGAGEGESR